MRRFIGVALMLAWPAYASAQLSESGLAKPQLLLQQVIGGMPKGEMQEVRVLTATFRPGDKTVYHTHRFPVAVYVLEGTFTPELDGRAPIVVRAGEANSRFAIAIGTASLALGENSVAIGAFAGGGGSGPHHFNTTIGAQSGRSVVGLGNTAVGNAAGQTVRGNENSAFGNSAGQRVTGSQNLAAGVLSGGAVNGSFNAAYGHGAGASVTGDNNIALGRGAGRSISATNTISIGNSARATAASSVAIGYSSTATAANTVSVGSTSTKRRIVNVANATATNDAVNLGQVRTLIAAANSTVSGTNTAPLDELRRELAELRALLKEQKEEIAQLRADRKMAANAD